MTTTEQSKETAMTSNIHPAPQEFTDAQREADPILRYSHHKE